MSEKNFRVPLAVGGLLLMGVITADLSRVLGFAVPRFLTALLALIGTGLVGWGVLLWQTREHQMDERFLIHRLKASRAALVVGLSGLCIWLIADLIQHDKIQWQVLLVLAAVAVTKVGAMLYYQRTG